MRVSGEKGPIGDWERLRQSYRPTLTRMLFVGESRPANGTFFYAGDSILHDAIRDGFLPTCQGFGGIGFLSYFAKLGCYVEDLCPEPVNQWKIRDPRRLAARDAGEAALAVRLTGLEPAVVVLVMKAIVPNVQRALSAATIASPVHALPFPGRPRHRETFVRNLSQIVAEFQRRNGFLGS